MSDDVLEQILTYVKESPFYSIQLDQRGPTATSRVNFGPRIITVINVITIRLPCVSKIPNISRNSGVLFGDNMAVRKFVQM